MGVPRPKKCRRVDFLPTVTVFKPAGVRRCGLEEIVLTVEELEAIRLKDQEGLEQEECAARMQVSRPTFQRILTSARAKVAHMLTGGLALRVEGGTYELAGRRRRCRRCQGEFAAPARPASPADEALCPKCRDDDREGPPAPDGRHRRHRRLWRRQMVTPEAPSHAEPPGDESEDTSQR
jgi:predicted DNA-binding protein (UPF0251 family)